MSYEITATAVEPPKPRVLPPEVNNFVTAYWFALGFGALMLLVFWPDLAGFLPAGFSFTAFLAVLGLLVLIGAWVSRGITLGNQTAMRVGKLSLLVGLVGLLVIAIGLIVFKLSGETKTPPGGIAPPTYFGASALLSASFLTILVLLPLLFAMLGFFMSMRDEVDAYFNPPAEEEMTEYRQPVVMGQDEVDEMLAEAPPDEELVAAELQAQEAALAEEGSGLESTGEGLSDSDKAAYDDHDAPLSMGEFELDEEPAAEPEEKKD